MGKVLQEICTDSNIPSSLGILNSNLNLLDLPEVSFSGKDPKSILAQLINVCYELSATVKKNNIRMNQQYEELLRTQKALRAEQKEKDKLAALLANEENRVEDLKVKIASNESQIFASKNLVKTMKREVSHLQNALVAQKIRHEHEVRRKDATISSLKTKIYQTFSNESCANLDKSRAHKTNKILSEEYDEILDKYVCQLHNNIQIVLEENSSLRDLIESLNNRVSMEILDFPDSILVSLSGLPCHQVVRTVENNLNLFFNKFILKDMTE